MKQGTSDFFKVANNTNLFVDQRIGRFLEKEFQKRFSLRVPFIEDPAHEAYIEQNFVNQIEFISEGFNRFCFRQFQREVAKTIGRERAKTLLWIDAESFTGVFLPLEIERVRIDFPQFEATLKMTLNRLFYSMLKPLVGTKSFPGKIDCASLFDLAGELVLFAREANLPVESRELEKLARECRNLFWTNNKNVPNWISVKFTFSQMMTAVNIALENRYAVWCN
jgi:hypothetical protein